MPQHRVFLYTKSRERNTKTGSACPSFSAAFSEWTGERSGEKAETGVDGPLTDKGNRLKVLVLSRNYPNAVTELLGLWVERLVMQSAHFCDIRIVAPVPYCPSFPRLPEKYARFRRIESRSSRNGLAVYHPRMLTGPGFSSYQ